MASKTGERRTFSDAYKAMIAAEFKDALGQLGSSYQAGRAVGRKYKIHPTQVERWARAIAERGGAPPATPPGPHANRYDPDFRAKVVEEIREGLRTDGGHIYSKLSHKYRVHNTTLRDWYRREAGAPGIDPETGKRTRGVRDAEGPYLRRPDDPPATPSVPAVAPPVHEYRHEDVERPPEVRWQMANGRPLSAEYLAQRVHELEHQVRVLGDQVTVLSAEKHNLMVTLGLVNTHKVDVPPRG